MVARRGEAELESFGRAAQDDLGRSELDDAISSVRRRSRQREWRWWMREWT